MLRKLSPPIAMRLSVIIPTLNEAAVLRTCLDALLPLRDSAELIVVDGGSKDGTRAIAERAQCILVEAAQGRGRQLAAGARVASGGVFWFLHADTIAPPDAAGQIERACADERVAAGNFRLIFDGVEPGAKFLTALYPQLRRLGLRYGDSGYFVRRAIYERAGGFRPLPIFEDLDLLRRVRPFGRWVTLAGPLITSSRRFAGRAFTPVFAKWTGLQILYWLGCDPVRLGRIYYREHPRAIAPPLTERNTA